jgi:polar amino acid transport system substrate-binding protein
MTLSTPNTTLLGADAMADALKELAPAGKLRGAINLGNSVLAQKDEATGEIKGITPDLAHRGRQGV